MPTTDGQSLDKGLRREWGVWKLIISGNRRCWDLFLSLETCDVSVLAITVFIFNVHILKLSHSLVWRSLVSFCVECLTARWLVSTVNVQFLQHHPMFWVRMCCSDMFTNISAYFNFTPCNTLTHSLNNKLIIAQTNALSTPAQHFEYGLKSCLALTLSCFISAHLCSMPIWLLLHLVKLFVCYFLLFSRKGQEYKRISCAKAFARGSLSSGLYFCLRKRECSIYVFTCK